MEDRIPKYPGRVKITPDGGGTPFYATVEMADEPTQEGTPLNKATLLSDNTIPLFNFTQKDPTVNDALRRSMGLVGDIRHTIRSDLDKTWLICNGQVVSRGEYPDLFSFLSLFNPSSVLEHKYTSEKLADRALKIGLYRGTYYAGGGRGSRLMQSEYINFPFVFTPLPVNISADDVNVFSDTLVVVGEESGRIKILQTSDKIQKNNWSVYDVDVSGSVMEHSVICELPGGYCIVSKERNGNLWFYTSKDLRGPWVKKQLQYSDHPDCVFCQSGFVVVAAGHTVLYATTSEFTTTSKLSFSELPGIPSIEKMTFSDATYVNGKWMLFGALTGSPSSAVVLFADDLLSGNWGKSIVTQNVPSTGYCTGNVIMHDGMFYAVVANSQSSTTVYKTKYLSEPWSSDAQMTGSEFKRPSITRIPDAFAVGGMSGGTFAFKPDLSRMVKLPQIKDEKYNTYIKSNEFLPKL